MADPKPAPKPTGPDLWAELQAGIKDIRTIVEKDLPEGFVQQHIRQSLQAAESSLDQMLRNFKIDAELEAKKAAGLIK